MAQYKYDKDGNYTGKILSESEHRDNRSSITPTKKCFFAVLVSAAVNQANYNA